MVATWLCFLMILPSGILFKKGSLRFLEIRSHCKKVSEQKVTFAALDVFFPGFRFRWVLVAIHWKPNWQAASALDCRELRLDRPNLWYRVGTGWWQLWRPFGSLFWRYSSEVFEWSSKSALKDSEARILLATDHQIIWFSALPKRGLRDIFDVWDAYIPSSGISGNFDSLIMDVGVRKRLKFWFPVDFSWKRN